MSLRPLSRGGWPVAGVILLPLFAGCADAAGRSGVEFQTDSLGVVHATNRGTGVWGEAEAWRIGEPTFRVGVLDGAEELTFGNITDIAVGRDGRVYVLDFQTKDIRVFGADGAFLFRFGRAGEGPGELSWPDALAFTPDGDLAVRDSRLFRVTLFSPDGEYRRDFRIRRPYPQMFAGSFWVTEAGVFVDRLSTTMGVASADSLTLIRYAPGGETRDTLLLAETRSAIVMVFRGNVSAAGMQLPFAPRATVAVATDGRIARALGDDYRIDILDPDGRLVRIITREVERVPVTEAERDSMSKAMTESAAELVDNGTLESFEFPARKPAITHLFTDAAGNWWAGALLVPQRFGPPTPHAEFFDVFDAEGRFLGSVDTPFRILEIGEDYVAGVMEDEMGVSYAVVAPLIKGGGAR